MGSTQRDPAHPPQRLPHRDLDTRVDTLDLAVPKLRSGTYFPDWLMERRKRADSALITVVADCYLARRVHAPHGSPAARDGRIAAGGTPKMVKNLGINAPSKS